MTRDKNFQTDLKPIFLLSLCLFQFGCAGFGKQLKSFLGGQGAASSTEVVKPNHVKYSDNSHLPTSIRRQYRRTTKKSLSEESQLDNKAGSLWVMEGQGSYLFSQNIIRMIGDPMPIRIEGEPRDQLQSKVGVIRKLLAKLEARNFPPVALRNPASSPGAGAAAPARGVAPEAAKTAEVKAPESPAPVDDSFSVQTVPTRITERLIDGNYRVRGSQPFMIGSREYKVIVTGIVRAEDFSDDGISSGKLLDPKYDIVSVKRKDE